MGCKTSILRPIIPKEKDDIGIDLIITLYYYLKNTMPSPKYSKVYQNLFL